jgi:hypothetical protein
MTVLRRRTGNVLLLGCVVVTLLGAWPAIIALAQRPETRLPALALWLALGIGLHRLAGEPLSVVSLVSAFAFTLPLTSTALAAYDAHACWGVPALACIAGVAAVLVLFGTVFLRLLVASGSADYPYDD